MAWNGRSEKGTGIDGAAVENWAGEYTYDVPPGVVGLPAGSKFTLEFHPAVLGFFQGEVRDDPVAGMAEPGRILGWQGRRRIHFVKRMPVRYKGVVDSKTKRAGELVRDEQKRHPMIFYTGVRTPDRNEFRGRWRFLSPFGIPGSWFARRAG
jgi:hypothetical protein